MFDLINKTFDERDLVYNYGVDQIILHTMYGPNANLALRSRMDPVYLILYPLVYHFANSQHKRTFCVNLLRSTSVLRNELVKLYKTFEDAISSKCVLKRKLKVAYAFASLLTYIGEYSVDEVYQYLNHCVNLLEKNGANLDIWELNIEVA